MQTHTQTWAACFSVVKHVEKNTWMMLGEQKMGKDLHEHKKKHTNKASHMWEHKFKLTHTHVDAHTLTFRHMKGPIRHLFW